MASGGSDWKEEAYKAYIRNWELQEAREAASRQRDGKVALWLVPGEGDAPVFSREQQAELQTFVSALRSQEIEADAPVMALDSADAFGGYIGQFAIEFANLASPVITVALVAWIKGRFGRKVVMEFYPNGMPKKVEANNPDQVRELIDHATIKTTPPQSD